MAVKKVPMYIKNVAKSIKYSGQDFIRQQMPSTMDFVETNTDVLKSVTTDLRNYKQVYKQAKKWWNASSVMGNINEAKQNAINDLKTGNFYNKARADKEAFASSGWEDVLGGFEDEMNSALNDYNEDSSLKAQEATTRSINSNTEATVGVVSAVGESVSNMMSESVSYIAQNQHNIAAQNMVNDYKMFSTVSNILSEMSTDVKGIYEFTGELAKYFNESTKGSGDLDNKMEQLIALTKEFTEMERNKYEEYRKSKDTKYYRSDDEDFLGSSFDIKGYFETVKKRTGREMQNMGLGGGGAMGDIDPLTMLASNPLRFISDAAFNKVISKEVKTSMGNLDKTVSGFFKSSMLKMSSNLKQKGQDNQAFDIMNRILGVNTSNPGNMKTGLYVKEAIPWNGIAERSLIEVIPTYLRKMLSAMTGQEEMIYDYKTGKFNKIIEIKKTLDSAVDSSYSDINDMKNTVTKSLNNFTFNNDTQKTIDSDVDKLFKFIVDKGVFYDPNKINNQFLKDNGLNLEGGDKSFDLINSAFKATGKQRWNQFNGEVTSAIGRRHNDVAELSKTGQLSGFTALDNGFKDQYDQESGLPTSTSGILMKDKWGKGINEYLRDIREILLDGIRVFSIEYDPNLFRELGSPDNRMERYTETMTIINNNSTVGYNRTQAELEEEARRNQGEVINSLDDISLSPIAQTEFFTRMANNVTEVPSENNNDPSNPSNPLDRVNGLLDNVLNAGREIASVPGKVVKGILDSVNDNLLFFLYGSEDGNDRSLLTKLMDRFNAMGEKLVTITNDKVIKPLNTLLFNPDNGIITKLQNKIDVVSTKVKDKLFDPDKGIFTNISKGFSELMNGTNQKPGVKAYFKYGISDMSNGFMNVLNGKEYTSSLTGKHIPARTETMWSIMKGAFTSISDHVKGLYNKHFANMSFKDTISNSINKHTATASRVLFGTADESMSPKDFFSRHISDKLPKSVLGAMGGIGLAMISPLGLIGGTLLGGATGFLSTTDSFKTVLFGEQGSDKRIKIDNMFQSFNEALPRMGVGALAGGALGLVTPFGLLGGSLLGGTVGYLSTSDKFKTWLFGNGADKQGIIKKEYYDKFKSYLPGGAVGTGMGALGSFFLPGGPVGGALMGLTLGIAGQSNTIKTYLFGEENPETNKRSGGLFGKMKLYMQTEILLPLKTFAKDVGSKGLYFIRKELLNPILDAMAPITKEISLIKDRMIAGVKDIKDRIFQRFDELIIKPFGETMNKYILDPIKNTFKNLFGGLFAAMKGIITAPSKIINSLGMNLMEKHKRDGDADYLDEWQKKKNARDKKAKDAYDTSQKQANQEKTKNKLISNLMRKGNYDPNSPASQKAMAWMNIGVSDNVKKVSDSMDQNTSILDRLSKLFSDFKSSWENRNNIRNDSSNQPSADDISSNFNNNSGNNEPEIPNNVIDLNNYRNNQPRADDISSNTNNNPEVRSENQNEPIIDINNNQPRADDITSNTNNDSTNNEPNIPNNVIDFIPPQPQPDEIRTETTTTDQNIPNNVIDFIPRQPQPDEIRTDVPKQPKNQTEFRTGVFTATKPINITDLVDDVSDINKNINNISNIITNNKPTNIPTDNQSDDNTDDKKPRDGIKSSINTIADSVDGQLNGVGYNTELIANILIEQFGMPSILPSGVRTFGHKIKSIFSKPKEFIKGIFSTIAEPFKAVIDTVKKIPETLFDIGKKTVEVVGGVIGAVGEVALATLGTVAKAIPGILDIVATTIKGAVNITVSMFKALPAVISTLGTVVKETSKVVGTLGVELVKGFGAGLKLATEAVGHLAIGVTKLAAEVIPALFRTVVGTLGFVGSGIKSMLGFGEKTIIKEKSYIVIDSIEYIKTVEKVQLVTNVDRVGVVEKISDARIYESMGNITTAIHGLRTGTDDIPVNFNVANEGMESIKDKVVDIKTVEKIHSVDNEGMVGVKDKASNSIKNTLIDIRTVEKVHSLDNVTKVGVVEKISDARIYESLGNITTAIHGLRTGTDDVPVNYTAAKEGMEGVKDKAGNSIKNTVVNINDRVKKANDKKKKATREVTKSLDNVIQFPNKTDITSKINSTGNNQVDMFKNKEKIQSVAKIQQAKNKLEIAADNANITTGKILSRVFKKGGIISTIGELLMMGLPMIFSFFKNIAFNALKLGKKGIDYFLSKFKINIPNVIPEVIPSVVSGGASVVASEVGSVGASTLVPNAPKLLSPPTKIPNTVLPNAGKGIISKIGLPSATKIGKEIVEEGMETGTKLLPGIVQEAAPKMGKVTGDIIENAAFEVFDEGGQTIAKSGIKQTIGRSATKMKNTGVGLINKILESNAVKKLVSLGDSSIVKALKPLGEFLTKNLSKQGAAFFAKLSAKWTAIVGTGAVSGGLIPALWYGGTILNGISATNRMFGMAPSYKPTMKMRAIAGFSAFVSNEITFGLISPDFIAQFLGAILLSDKESAIVSEASEVLHQDYENYIANPENEQVTFKEYNKKIANASIMTKAWEGTKDVVGGTVDLVKKGWENTKSYAMNNTLFSAFNDDLIRETFGLDPGVKLTAQDRLSMGTGTVLSNMTFGLIKKDSIAKTVSGAIISVKEGWEYAKGKIKDYALNNTLFTAYNDDLIKQTFGMDADATITSQDRLSMGAGTVLSNMTFGLIKKSQASNSINDAIDNFKNIWKNIGDKFKEILGLIPKALETFDKKMGELFNFQDDDGNPLKFTEFFKVKVAEVKTTVGNVVDNVKSTIKYGVDGIYDKVTSKLQKKSDDLSAQRNAVVQGGNGLEKNAGGETEGGNNSTANNVPYFSQNAEPWASVDYGYGKNISQAGCGPTSAAMLLSGVTGKTVTPKETAQFALSNGHRIQGNGTDWAYFNNLGNKYGVGFNQTSNFNAVTSALSQGYPAILSGKGEKPFTKGGHYVVAVGQSSDGKIIVNDPVSKARSIPYDPSLIQSETAQAWISNKQLTDKPVATSANNVVQGTSSTSSNSSSSDSSTGNKFTDALSKLGTITSSYLSTVIGGDTWDESLLEKNTAYDNSSDSTTAETPQSSSYSGDATMVSLGRDSTAETINSKLRGSLSGYGQTFVDIGRKYGVDPALAAAITMSETGGTSTALTKNNNPAGIMDWNNNWKTVKTFNSLSEGLDFTVKNLKQTYLDQGLTTIPAIGSKYAPIGASNDPGGLNKNWVPSVSTFYSQMTTDGGGAGEESPNLTPMKSSLFGNSNLPEFGGAGEESPNALNVSSMKTSLFGNSNLPEFGGAGEDTEVELQTKAIDTNDFILNNFRVANDNINNTLTAQKLVKEDGFDGAKIDQIIAILANISDNTKDTVSEIKNNGKKLDVIKDKETVQANINKTDNTTNVNGSNKSSVDPFTQLATNNSTNRLSKSYEMAKQIARGRKN